jgi:hypothetical protein
MRFWIVVAAMIGLLLAWEAGLKAQTKPVEPVVGRVAVSARGAVSFDGVAITIDALQQKLGDLKKRDGVVWYYREAGRDEPPSQAVQVMKLIIDEGLPISMSTKPDYSDVLLPDGTTRPRPGVRQR